MQGPPLSSFRFFLPEGGKDLLADPKLWEKDLRRAVRDAEQKIRWGAKDVPPEALLVNKKSDEGVSGGSGMEGGPLEGCLR
jgi:hypothetical protein